MRPRLMQGRDVIAVDLPDSPGEVRYVGKKTRHGAPDYTSDINEAKVWRHPGVAQGILQGRNWPDGYNPRIVDPRKVAGYVDKPTAAARRQKKECKSLDSVLAKLEASIPPAKASPDGCRWCDCEHKGEDESCTCENYAAHKYFRSGGRR